MKSMIFGMILFIALLLGMAGSESTSYYASDEEEWHLEIAYEDNYTNCFYEM